MAAQQDRAGLDATGGSKDTPAAGERRWVELSHVITAGMVTYPGIPGPCYV